LYFFKLEIFFNKFYPIKVKTLNHLIRAALSGLLFMSSYTAMAQNRTANGDGGWAATSSWSGEQVTDVVTENATLNNDVGLTLSTVSMTTGNVTMLDRTSITIQSSATLNIGDATNPRSLSSANDTEIIVITGATLVIWGDLEANDRLSIVSAGDVIIRGSLLLSNDASLSVSGNLTVESDFEMSDRASVTVSGDFDIGGDITGKNDNSFNVYGALSVTGSADFGDRNCAVVSGSISVGGGCSDNDGCPSGGAFCDSSMPLPFHSFPFTQRNPMSVPG